MDRDDRVIRKRLRFRGAVQGVGFRWRAKHAAAAVGVTGWVRNDADESVSMELQGTEEQIDRVIGMIGAGAYVRIESMEARSIPVEADERGFGVRYGGR